MTQRWNYYLAERPFSRCLGQPLPNAAHVSLCSPCQTCELRSPGRLITGCGHGAINEKVLTEPDSRGLEGFGCGLGRAPPDASPRYRRSAHWRGRKGFAPCSDAHAVIGSTVCGCGGYFVASRRRVGERRHITVMFCDLVGSTDIAAGRDGEEWRDLVAAYLDTASAGCCGNGRQSRQEGRLPGGAGDVQSVLCGRRSQYNGY